VGLRLTAIFRIVRIALTSLSGVLTVLVVTCSASFPQAVAALEPGVHIDPGSPAAKEYALPVNQARQTGSPRSAGGGTSEALFGAGIKPTGQSGSTGSHISRAVGYRVDARPSNRSYPSLPPATLSASNSQARSGAGSGSILTLLGGGVAILVIGGFVGTMLRRNRYATPKT
jgi:hypothetical protein